MVPGGPGNRDRRMHTNNIKRRDPRTKPGILEGAHGNTRGRCSYPKETLGAFLYNIRYIK